MRSIARSVVSDKIGSVRLETGDVATGLEHLRLEAGYASHNGDGVASFDGDKVGSACLEAGVLTTGPELFRLEVGDASHNTGDGDFKLDGDKMGKACCMDAGVEMSGSELVRLGVGDASHECAEGLPSETGEDGAEHSFGELCGVAGESDVEGGTSTATSMSNKSSRGLCAAATATCGVLEIGSQSCSSAGTESLPLVASFFEHEIAAVAV